MAIDSRPKDVCFPVCLIQINILACVKDDRIIQEHIEYTIGVPLVNEYATLHPYTQ